MHSFVAYRAYEGERRRLVWNASPRAPRTILIDGVPAVLREELPPDEHAPVIGERVLVRLSDPQDMLEYVASSDCVSWADVEHYRWDDDEDVFLVDLVRHLGIGLDYGMGVLRTVTPSLARANGWTTEGSPSPEAH